LSPAVEGPLANTSAKREREDSDNVLTDEEEAAVYARLKVCLGYFHILYYFSVTHSTACSLGKGGGEEAYQSQIGALGKL